MSGRLNGLNLRIRKVKLTKGRVEQLEFGGWNKLRHRKLEVCGDETSEMALLGFFTYEIDEEGNKVEIELEEIKRVKLGRTMSRKMSPVYRKVAGRA